MLFRSKNSKKKKSGQNEEPKPKAKPKPKVSVFKRVQNVLNNMRSFDDIITILSYNYEFK